MEKLKFSGNPYIWVVLVVFCQLVTTKVEAQCNFNVCGNATCDATDMSSGSDCIYRLTTTDPSSQRGTVHYDAPGGGGPESDRVDFANDFDEYFNVFFGCNGNGGDGLAFVLHRNGNNFVGGYGGGMGYADNSGNPDPPYLTLEFDTYDNGGADENALDNIILTENGLTNDPYGTETPVVLDDGELADGKIYTVRIFYDASATLLSVYLYEEGTSEPATPNYSVTVDIDTYFSGDPANWGWTSASFGTDLWFSHNGTSTPPTFTPSCTETLPVEWGDIGIQQNSNGDALLRWVTFSEENNDYFSVQYSVNGESYTEIAVLAGANQSEQVNVYEYPIDQNMSSGYFRVVQYDLDGSNTASRIVKYNGIESSLSVWVMNPMEKGESLKFAVNSNADMHGDYQIKVIDLSGRVVHETIQENLNHNSVTNLEASTSFLEDLASGTYFFRVQSILTGEIAQTRLIVH